MDLNNNLFFAGMACVAPPLMVALYIWRVVVVRLKYRYPDSVVGPLWAFALGMVLLCSSLGAFMVGIERTDGIDYPDGGHSAEWSGFGAIAMVVGFGLVFYGNAFKTPEMDEEDHSGSG